LEAEVNEKGHVLTLQSDFVDHPGLSEQVDDVYPAQTLWWMRFETRRRAKNNRDKHVAGKTI